MPGFFGRSSNLVWLGCLFFLPALATAQPAPSDLVVPANIVEIDASRPSPTPQPSDFKGGSSLSPSGESIGLNDQYLIRDGKPWLPVMGEFHFSRYPDADWEEEILKMKAGGVQIISSYIFWNEEEIQGAPRWQLTLPAGAFAGVSDLFLKVEYRGDIARLSAAGHLLADDFYNGMPWCIGLKRFRRQVESGAMEISIIPWRDRANVVLDDFAVNQAGDKSPHLLKVTVLPEYQLTVP